MSGKSLLSRPAAIGWGVPSGQTSETTAQMFVCGAVVASRSSTLAGPPELHGRLRADPVRDAGEIVIKPGPGIREPAVGALGRAVVRADDLEVRAVAAQLLEGLERATRLDVEEPVDHQDREVVDVA